MTAIIEFCACAWVYLFVLSIVLLIRYWKDVTNG
jgi:hypothetical protein